MKKLLVLALSVAFASVLFAQVAISRTEKISPTDETFMDMAVTAAQTAQEQGKPATGAVLILNGAWRSTGLPSDGVTPEESAITKARRKDLSLATIYTVNEPTAAAWRAIIAAKISAVYYVNSAAEAVAAGIYPASAYDPAMLDSAAAALKVVQITYAPASELMK